MCCKTNRENLRTTVIGVVSFSVAILLLNGTSLMKKASELEYGVKRNFWMKVLTPIDAASRFTRLNAVRDSVHTFMIDTNLI